MYIVVTKSVMVCSFIHEVKRNKSVKRCVRKIPNYLCVSPVLTTECYEIKTYYSPLLLVFLHNLDHKLVAALFLTARLRIQCSGRTIPPYGSRPWKCGFRPRTCTHCKKGYRFSRRQPGCQMVSKEFGENKGIVMR